MKIMKGSHDFDKDVAIFSGVGKTFILHVWTGGEANNDAVSE